VNNKQNNKRKTDNFKLYFDAHQFSDALCNLSRDVSELVLGLGRRPVEAVHHHLEEFAILDRNVVARLQGPDSDLGLG
jgi:hypothetical protein